ncbi:MAG: ABC transporter substrate-binding protein [Alphaproteobacteria bacterium]|nr:ABC transporter substrate-binding protein [Alphaproteobacteria bacterium]
MSTNSLTRRQFVRTSAAIGVAAATVTGLPRFAASEEKTVKVGFLAPLTGEVAGWGLPGRDGCLIWADWVNAAGGIKVGADSYKVEIVSYDDEYAPDKALLGGKKLVLEDGVKIVLMLGGDPWPGVQPFMNEQKMLCTTLLPSDLSPDTPYLLAPCEVHPIYNVTGVEWLAANHPEAKTAAIVAQQDALGLPSVATYRAAFEASGIKVVHEKFFDIATTDFAPIVTAMLATKPDIICFDTAYPDYVNLLCEQAFHQGFKGKIVSCTMDNYPQIIEKTSKEFMEGVIFQFPDFDDPALEGTGINFKNANAFFAEYNKRFPGTWTAVSWEYASILELWKAAVEKAGSVEPLAALEAMKAGGRAPHIFGDAQWWGKDLFGIDNALVGNWPVVRITDGKAKIVEYRSIPVWWDKNKDVLIKHFRDLKQMWDQRA